jgi:hypothetical protein
LTDSENTGGCSQCEAKTSDSDGKELPSPQFILWFIFKFPEITDPSVKSFFMHLLQVLAYENIG